VPLLANLQRLGREIPVVAMDVRQPAIGSAFKRVVVDLPCSGTGTLRKHPELKWRVSQQELERLSAASLGLLESAAQMVEPDGILVAITCSLEDIENEAVAERFLKMHGAFSPLDLGEVLRSPAGAFVQGPGLWRILTGGDHDGFTVQVFGRSSTSA
jgi:16S rRNA C967 or C1407 C5-methylase (RsmB/RsmF family)